MSLTAGAVLQNGRYVIEAILDESDLGITYQANHAYLSQSVIIQTIQDQGITPEKADKLRQHFLAGVRRLVKGKYPYPGRVLDYFTEAELPFLVLEQLKGQAPPDMQQWLPPLETEKADQAPDTLNRGNQLDQTHKPDQAEQADDRETDKAQLHNDNPAIAVPEQSNLNHPASISDHHDNPAIADISAIAVPEQSNLNHPASISDHHSPTVTPPTLPFTDQAFYAEVTAAVEAHQNGSSSKKQPALQHTVGVTPTKAVGRSTPVKPSKKKLNPLLPAALVTTSVVAGLVGAGFGWSVRFEPSGQPRVGNNPIFSREQSFPPTDSWPIQESVDLAPPDQVWDRADDVPTYAPVRRRDRVEYAPEPAEPLPEDKVISPDSNTDTFKAPPISEPGDALTPEVPPLPEPAPDSSIPSPDPDPVPLPEPVQQAPVPLPAPVTEPPVSAPPSNSSVPQAPAPVVQ